MDRYYRITTSSEETVELGEQIGKLLKPGDFVFCSGELGVGKTELIRGITQGVFGRESLHLVASPSFNYVNVYQIDEKVVYHFDLYRVQNVQQLSDLGLEELFFSNSICCVEWPQLLCNIIRQNVLQIELVFSCNFLRKVVIDTHLFRNVDLSHMFRIEK